MFSTYRSNFFDFTFERNLDIDDIDMEERVKSFLNGEIWQFSYEEIPEEVLDNFSSVPDVRDLMVRYNEDFREKLLSDILPPCLTLEVENSCICLCIFIEDGANIRSVNVDSNVARLFVENLHDLLRDGDDNMAPLFQGGGGKSTKSAK